jgi:hypothetical protein
MSKKIKRKCACDSGDGQFCFICCPSLCDEKTLEEEYISLMVLYRGIDEDLRILMSECECEDKRKRCDRCQEIRDILGMEGDEV